MRMPRVCLVAAGLAALLAARPAPTQIQVRGVLLDAGSGAPISSARVHLGATRGGWREEILTDSAGGFVFDDVRPGPYRLRARRVGYRESSGTLRLSADSVVELQLRMAVASVALAPVTVVTRSRRTVSPVLEGFYGRLERGQGRFVTREEIEARSPTRVTDMLRTLPGLNGHAARGGVGGMTMSRGSSGDRCTVVFFVDGMLVSQPSMGGPFRGSPRQDQAIDDYVQPSEVEGIEIYRGESDTPAEFVTRWVGCGTIVIWTRRGETRGE
ncbi:TonB-dependent receptor [Longimicrobium sp.]|uniref:TonB-dependent receptor n=1 Tax=Longimicrobium sp. TaxID=2029185 RepID=UPI002E30B405|nr:TonB-dependent receptor [Longimicrobium sp.]HEX6039142.1 TonB-dependent receptor [Longimicrobium sp.]